MHKSPSSESSRSLLSTSSSSPLASSLSSIVASSSSSCSSDDEEYIEEDRDETGDGDVAASNTEVIRLRETIDLLNLLITANTKQYDEMVSRIAILEREKAVYMRKRKRAKRDEEEEEDEHEPNAKQRINESDEMMRCRTCDEELPIETFERTSMRKRCIDGTYKVYYYHRNHCKTCTNRQRRERHRKRLK